MSGSIQPKPFDLDAIKQFIEVARSAGATPTSLEVLEQYRLARQSVDQKYSS